MVVNARLIIAAALLAGSASVAVAQSARYDYSDDRALSYGPLAPTQSGAETAGTASQIGRDAFNPNDTTDDKAFSYGVRN